MGGGVRALTARSGAVHGREGAWSPHGSRGCCRIRWLSAGGHETAAAGHVEALGTGGGRGPGRECDGDCNCAPGSRTVARTHGHLAWSPGRPQQPVGPAARCRPPVRLAVAVARSLGRRSSATRRSSVGAGLPLLSIPGLTPPPGGPPAAGRHSPRRTRTRAGRVRRGGPGPARPWERRQLNRRVDGRINSRVDDQSDGACHGWRATARARRRRWPALRDRPGPGPVNREGQARPGLSLRAVLHHRRDPPTRSTDQGRTEER